jgi:hypothetical protein
MPSLHQLWYSGFGISKSLAAEAINGDDINMTLYYVLSNSPSPIHEIERSEPERFGLEKLLYFPNRCFEDHQTLYVSILCMVHSDQNK